jgi:hypothetical protein
MQVADGEGARVNTRSAAMCVYGRNLLKRSIQAQITTTSQNGVNPGSADFGTWRRI